MTVTPSPIDPAGPVFISYRRSDGVGVAADLAWLLRASGLPVWRDMEDLPPGDTTQRLRQAIAHGLSGAVLVITPEVTLSGVVRTVEAPDLVSLHRQNPAFALGIISAIEDEDGNLDYEAPGHLLQASPGTLDDLELQRADAEGLGRLVRKLLWHRIAQLRALVAAHDATFELTVQTRNSPQVYDRTEGQLDIRVRPPSHERLPSLRGLADLAATIGSLPDAVTRSGAKRVRICGGAHLSVAFAVGAALPSSRIGHLVVVDQRGVSWTSGEEPILAAPAVLSVRAHAMNPTPTTTGRPAVAVYLDLVPGASDGAFTRYLDENESRLAAWAHLTSAQDGLLDPAHAAAVAGEAAARIRAIANQNGNAEVHLLLRCPFPLAVLVGRLTNTIRAIVYEWDDATAEGDHDHRARYVPMMRIRASAASGVIEEVLG